MKKWFTLLYCLTLTAALATEVEKPNIIFILADDMGYGDMSHSGGKVPTPACDRLADEGMRFLDAHTSSAVCTPTRYGILTGRYNWRSPLKKGVLWGFSDPLISAKRQTVAGFLRDQGYHTGMIGKWHLGIGWQRFADGQQYRNGKLIKKKSKKAIKKGHHSEGWYIDYSKPVIGPTNNGFDSFWGISASLDMPPYVYIKNDRVETQPTVTKAFHRPGPSAVDFEANKCLADFARKSREYIRTQAADKTKPFFLYLPLTSPHTPIVPSARWKGKSKIGSYGDFLMETDWVVNEVLAELDAQGIAKNTMVIFTADNGCSPAAKIPNLIKKGHKPNGDWRGHKADIYEGGHRVPFLVRWPAQVKAKSTSSATLCTTDFFSTAADVSGSKSSIADNAAEDSISFLPVLLGKSKAVRESIIHHSINGSFSIRQGKWKLNLCPGSGGWSYPNPNRDRKALAKMPPIQLYNLEADPTEKNNLQAANPEIVKSLIAKLSEQIKNGRSTPGAKQSNDGAVPFARNILKRFPELKQK